MMILTNSKSCHWFWLLPLCLTLWATPVAAEVITIDPLQPPSPLLSAAEMAKLTALQNTQEIFLFSAVSPDDSTIVMGSVAIGGATSEPAPPQAVFLNLADGTTEPIDPLFVMLSPQSTVVWRNAQTALYLARSETGEPCL